MGVKNQFAASGRRKLWELELKLHCPVIGTCLDMDELVRFARRFGFNGSLHNEYELHVEAVHLCDKRNPASELFQKHLDRKYQRYCQQFAKAQGDAEVRAMWQDCLCRGEVAGPMWAALTHRDASFTTRHQIYADIHMLSHQVGAGQAADARRLKHLEQEQAQWRQTLDKERRQRLQLEQRLNQVQQRYEQEQQRRLCGEQEHADLSRRLAELEAAQGSGPRDLGRRLEVSETDLHKERERNRALSEALHETERQLAELRAAHQTLQASHQRLEALWQGNESSGAHEDRVADCHGCDWQHPQRCVLCVGGRPAQVAHYRELAGRMGFRLLHHDGGKEEAITRLPEMIHSADAVLCPTDCVSHNAYYTLKQQCKRGGKPCVLFRGTGLASFVAALEQVATGTVVRA